MMRRLISIVENAEDVDPIDAMIKRAGYSEDEIEDATCGLCGTFALALYRYLTKQGIASQLVFFSEADDGQDVPPGYLWRHVAVKVGERYYDIRGRVSPMFVHGEFFTTQIVPVSEATVLTELRKINREDSQFTQSWTDPRAYSNKRLHDWKGRLRA